jgi:hypothetical protein
MGQKRRILHWPAEAAEIARGEAGPNDKCAELAHVSGNQKQDCWRFLKRYGIERPPSQRRKRSRWPEEAPSLAERKASPASICAELMRISGNGEKACWRYLEQHGVRRPGSNTRNTFSDQLFERVLEYSAEHGIQAASSRFNLSPKSISNVLYRREQTGLAHDTLTLRISACFCGCGPIPCLVGSRRDGSWRRATFAKMAGSSVAFSMMQSSVFVTSTERSCCSGAGPRSA